MKATKTWTGTSLITGNKATFTWRLRYTEMKAQLDATWREQPNHVRAIAARYYVGAETAATLRMLASERPVSGDFRLPPALSDRQVQFIINSR